MSQDKMSMAVTTFEAPKDVIVIIPQGVGPGHPVHDTLVGFTKTAWLESYNIDEFTEDEAGNDLLAEMLNMYLDDTGALTEDEILDQGGALILATHKVVFATHSILSIVVGYYPDTLDEDEDEADDATNWGH